MKFPDPRSAEWPSTRDKFLVAAYPRLCAAIDVDLTWYQREFLVPPAPDGMTSAEWLTHLLVINKGGAKRTGKSFDLAVAMLPYPFIPGSRTRLYGFEHENCQREMSWLELLLFRGWEDAEGRSHQPLSAAFPKLESGLVKAQLDPTMGQLLLEWDNGATISSKSWKNRNQWPGEPIDLGVVCEPGMLPGIHCYTRYIRPNQRDRQGLVRIAGTVEASWPKEIHNVACGRTQEQVAQYAAVEEAMRMGQSIEGHEAPSASARHYCVCQIPIWQNRFLGLTRTSVNAEYDRGETLPQDFAINDLGLWDSIGGMAYPIFDKDTNCISMKFSAWMKLKGGAPGWDHFCSLDTGAKASLGEQVVNQRGHVIRLDEWTTYEYRAGQLQVTEHRGFQTWFREILYRGLFGPDGTGLAGRRHVTYIDPSSQFKNDLDDLGVVWADSENSHEPTVQNVNRYLHLRRVQIVTEVVDDVTGEVVYRPNRSLVYEIPKVRWRDKDVGRSGIMILERGEDHAADDFRYGLAAYPIATPFPADRKLPTTDQDEKWLLEGAAPQGTTSPYSTDDIGIV